MGWDYTFAHHYKKGRIDRKAEVDERLTWDVKDKDGNIIRSVSVVKSQMLGSVYYGAISNGLGEVVGVVVPTKTMNSQIGMKIMDESVGPCYVECPNSILKLLTPTTNEYALFWRKKCQENIDSPKRQLKKLKAGSRISFVNPYENLVSGTPLGATVQLTKVFRYRKTIWSDGFYSWSPSLIPDDWKVDYAA